MRTNPQANQCPLEAQPQGRGPMRARERDRLSVQPINPLWGGTRRLSGFPLRVNYQIAKLTKLNKLGSVSAMFVE